MVEVVQSKVEELALDAQVDLLVSEPMGTLLVNERMLETYLYARNRFLKKGGRMFPVSKASCTLCLHRPGLAAGKAVQSAQGTSCAQLCRQIGDDMMCTAL